MNQKEFSYSNSKLKASNDVKAKFIKNPPEWAILWAAQKGMLTEGSYSVKVAVNGNALDFFVEKDTEPTNLVIGKNTDSYFCNISDRKPNEIETHDGIKWFVGCDGGLMKLPLISGIVLSPRERVVNGVTEKWHTRIR